MKRILICASRISHIIQFHLPYLKWFTRLGYEVHIAAEGAAENAFRNAIFPLEETDIPKHCYDLRFVKNPASPENLKTIRILHRLMRDNAYEMVYSNATLAGFALRTAVRRLPKDKRPYCVHISHGYMFDDSRSLKSVLYRTAEKRNANVTDALIVMNREDQMLAEKYHLCRRIVLTNGMGLCSERFPEISSQERQETRKQYGAEESTLLILCVGEFCHRKNQLLLLKALNLLQSDVRHIRLIFAGTGETLNECREFAKRYELTHFVRFAGQVQDMNRLYRSADLLLSASKMEGLPFNLLESLYCHVPVIASDIKGHRDLIRNGENGLLFSLQSEHADTELCDTIKTVLHDKTLYPTIKSHAALNEAFLADAVSPQILQVLDKDYFKHIPVPSGSNETARRFAAVGK